MKLGRLAVGGVCLLIFTATHAYATDDCFFDSNGVQIHYTVEGKGDPVLLIHGFSVNSQLQWGIPGIPKKRRLASW